MRKVLPLLGAMALLSLLVGLSGCVLETKTLTIVITDYVCIGFEENHDDENYTDDTVTFDDSFFEDLDALLADNDMTKDDVEAVSVVGVYYQVTAGPTNPPWTVAGRIWIEIDGGGQVLLAEYEDLLLTGTMADPIRIRTFDPGLAVFNVALETYLSESNPGNYPVIVFTSDREQGDIDPSPTLGAPFVMSWNGCLSMRVDFTEEYDVFDLFPSD